MYEVSICDDSAWSGEGNQKPEVVLCRVHFIRDTDNICEYVSTAASNGTILATSRVGKTASW